ncbi:MFS transporter [Jiangella sp. DSM 45060]|uniref:MFS transporter n=1 Tax=Jiangella sp. DSM 45060 TaxID=1798224 RepID=UPI00087DBF6E|nr:MFS transporter [Jiangella sp. DSM 45060]SDS04430.1 Predicted arabinose efflux permease, MFS family [Jiangella sp. DSM 45060]
MTDSTRTARLSPLVMVAMILAVSMSFIDQTIVAIASPDLQRDLGLTSNEGEWVINAYLVALAATFALGGRIADAWGARRMVLVGVAGFAVMSALCGATPDASWAEAWLITARAAQGVFAAVLLPAAISIVYGSAAPEKRGRSMAMFFGLTGAFTALGPVLGSYLLEWSWRTIFWINLPVAAAALVGVVLAPIGEHRRPGAIDWLGAAMVAAGMALSVVGFSQATEWGWTSVWTWACLVGGAVLLVLFGFVERRRHPPLIRLDIFRLRGFRVDSGVLFFAMVAFVPVAYFLSVYAAVSLGLDAGGASTLLLLYFLGFLLAAQVGGRIFDAWGAKPTILLGCAVGIAGYARWATQVTTLDASDQHHPLLLAGAGIGFLLGPASADAVSRTHDASYGEVTGINQTIRNYGSALGFAVLGTIATHVFTDRFASSLVGLGVGRSTADELAQRAATSGGGDRDLSGVPASARGAVEQAVAADFAESIRAVLIAMAVALTVAFLIALRHPGDRPAQEDAKRTEPDRASTPSHPA